MEYRELGNSGLMVSEVILGTWSMGGTEWGTTDDSESIAAIGRGIELGITTIDTAPAYGWGHAEELVGEAIQGYPREELIIASKTGLDHDEARPFFRNCSREHVIRTIDESLSRLRTEYIDLHQIHWPDPDTPLEETMEAMVEIQQAGKVRHIGVSNFDADLMEGALKATKIASLQPPYNLFRRGIETDILPFCREHGIGVIVYSPLAKGLLTGKFKGDETFPENDVRRHNPQFHGEEFEKNAAMVERLRPIAEKYGKTRAQLAIRWILEQPGISAAIVGAKRPSQVEDNAGASGWRLSEEDMAEMAEIFGRNA